MKKQRLLSLLLAITTVLAMIPSLVVAVSATRTETVTLTDANKNADGYYNIPADAKEVVIDEVTYIVIDSAEQMNTYAAVGGTNSYILADDLNYGDTNGAFTRIKIDTGIFDGNGHSMYGYTLNNWCTFTGVSGESNIRIRNITIGKSGAPIVVESNDTSAGGKVGIGLIFNYTNATHTLENVTGYATVTSTGTAHAGGLIGQINGSLTMNNCSFHGSVSGKKNTGGLIGQTGATTTIVNCTNYATVSGSSSTGGFIGATVAGSSLNISNSINAGTIEAGSHTGGLIGYFTDSLSNVTNFVNIGAIHGKWSGGIIGSTVPGTGKLNLTNCGSFAAVTGTSKKSSIIGNQTGGTIEVSGLVGIDVSGNPKVPLEKETVSLEQGVKWLRDLKDEQGNKVFASHIFALSDDGLSVVIVGSNDTAAVAETKFLQYKKNTNTMDIRVLGVFNDKDLTKYANAGFEITLKKNGVATHDEPIVETVTEVYSSIIANEDEGDTIKTYTAADLGATYLFAVTLTNIPTTGNFTIEVRAFANEIGATETAYDNLVVINVVNGAIQ